MFLEIILDSELDLHSKFFLRAQKRLQKRHSKFYYKSAYSLPPYILLYFLVPNKQRHNSFESRFSNLRLELRDLLDSDGNRNVLVTTEFCIME